MRLTGIVVPIYQLDKADVAWDSDAGKLEARLQQTEILFRQAIWSSNGKDVRPYRGLGVTQMALGKGNSAMVTLSYALRLNGSNLVLQWLWGTAAELVTDRQEATQARIDNILWRRMVWGLSKVGRRDELINELDALVRERPGTPDYHRELVTLFLELVGARVSFPRAFQHPSSVSARTLWDYYITMGDMGRKDFQEAIEWYAAAASLSLERYGELADAYMNTETELAIQYDSPSTSKQARYPNTVSHGIPGNPVVHSNRGSTYQRQGEFVQAAYEYALSALLHGALPSEWTQYHIFMTGLYLDMGLDKCAAHEFQEVLRLATDSTREWAEKEWWAAEQLAQYGQQPSTPELSPDCPFRELASSRSLRNGTKP